MTMALVDDFKRGLCYPDLDIEALYTKSEIKCVAGSESDGTAFCRVPESYYDYLPPILRRHAWDDILVQPVVDSEGVCFMLVANGDRESSKMRVNEVDGLQALVDAVWQEGQADLFEIPIACCVDYMCFRVLAAPLQLWLRNEDRYSVFLDGATAADAEKLATWQKANAQVASVLENISRHLSGCDAYPVSCASASANDSPSSLWLAVNRQKLVPYCPVDLINVAEPDDARMDGLIAKLTDVDSLVTSALVFRSLLREAGIRVRHLGKLLRRLELPVFKEVVVREMLSRAAKWHMRYEILKCIKAGSKIIPDFDLHQLLIDREPHFLADAANYFGVPINEISPYVTDLSGFTAKYFKDLNFAPNRSLFPHAHLLNLRGHFPKLRFVSPRPSPITPDTSAATLVDSLPLRYAAKLFELELAIAGGDVLEAAVVIGALADVMLRMRAIDPLAANKEQMRLKILALCEAGRKLVPPALAVPLQISVATLECAPSVKLYETVRAEVELLEGADSVALLSLDLVMAKHLFEAQPGLAVRILTRVIAKAERALGARHTVTVSALVRKGQAIKRAVEMAPTLPTKERQELIQEGVKALTKAVTIVETQDASPLTMIDQTSLVHHVLSLLFFWNGETAKAVAVSKEGLARTERLFGVLHPRYLNFAFLHAKLLENYAALVPDAHIAAQTAREAVSLLERVLDSLQDLSRESDEDSEIVKELTRLLGPEYLNSDSDVKRKLAIVALLLKLNVWLLDPSLAGDILDLLIADQLTGTRGVLALPPREAVKEAVTQVLAARLADSVQIDKPPPVLELASSLPEQVLTCCNMALLANAKGTPVTEWFQAFVAETLRSMGDSSGNRDLLSTLFRTFVFVVSTEDTYVGPLALPLVPRKPAKDQPHSHGVIYRDWEISATLFAIDHELHVG